MPGIVVKYTNLITSEHANKPNYMAMVQQTCQPYSDLIAVLQSMSQLFDLDQAVGNQLDIVGQWIGVTRNLTEPLSGVYFALDTTAVGFDQGVWKGPFDPTTGIVQLPDTYYRLLLKAKILNNSWACDKPDAYTLLNVLFVPLGYTVFIIDPADLTMQIGIVGAAPPDALLSALITSGELNLRPAGVLVNGYWFQSQTGPIFALDLVNSNFSGFDKAAWATLIP